MYFRFLFALILVALLGSQASAQNTATPVITGYLSTSGCSSPALTPCFIQYGAGGASTVTIGAPLGVQTAAASVAVICNSGCSGGPADESAFTAGTSSITTGGFFQTTATNNALTTGQAGSVQMTSTRSFFVNLRNNAGAEAGVAAVPLQVSLANTGSNATAVLVTGAGGTFPISGATSNASSAVATSSTNAPTVAYNYGFNGTTWDQIQVDASKNLKTTTIGTGTAGSAATGVVTVQGIASMTKLLVTPDSVALPANQSVNVSQINGVTPLMGNGVTGTGSQRVTIASDNTPVPTNLVITDSAPATQNVTVVDSGSTSTTYSNGQVYVTGSATASSTASFTLANGYDGAKILVTGTWTGTLATEMSLDGGTTWIGVGLQQEAAGGFVGRSWTNNFAGQIVINGATNVRVRATAAMTGTATVKMVASVNPGAIYVQSPPLLGVLNGWTPLLANALSTTVKAVKATQGQLGMLQCYNPNATQVYIQVFSVASGSVTLGTTVPALSIPIGPTATGGYALSNPGINVGGTGLSVAATTTATGLTAPGTATDCNIAYN